MMTTLALKGIEIKFSCSSGIRNNGNGDFFDTEVLELTCEAMGEMALCKIAYMLENGYPKCYNDIKDYMIDWSMDLPWDSSRCISYKHMRNHTSFQYIRDEFKKQYPDCEFIPE